MLSVPFFLTLCCHIPACMPIHFPICLVHSGARFPCSDRLLPQLLSFHGSFLSFDTNAVQSSEGRKTRNIPTNECITFCINTAFLPERDYAKRKRPRSHNSDQMSQPPAWPPSQLQRQRTALIILSPCQKRQRNAAKSLLWPFSHILVI